MFLTKICLQKKFTNFFFEIYLCGYAEPISGNQMENYATRQADKNFRNT